MSDWFGVILTIVLLLGNAFFVGAEFALISSRRDRLEALALQGKLRARTVISASEHLSMMLATSQLGITLCSILLGRVGEPAIAHLLEAPFAALGIGHALLHTVSFILALTVVTVLHILFGEMIPKNLALAGPERAAMLLVPANMWCMRLFRPIITVYNWIANATLKLMNVDPKDEVDNTVSPEELRAMIGESRQEGLLDEEENIRLVRALKAAERTVSEVAIPLDAVRSIPLEGDGFRLSAVEEAVRETGYSRFPLCDSTNQFIGFIHVKDVLDRVIAATAASQNDVGSRPSPSSASASPVQVASTDPLIPTEEIRPLPSVPATAPLDDVLDTLRRHASHLATVTDSESGNPVGLVALEDLMEEFVGTVTDSTHRAPDEV